jgi:hypothetical protein
VYSVSPDTEALDRGSGLAMDAGGRKEGRGEGESRIGCEANREFTEINCIGLRKGL